MKVRLNFLKSNYPASMSHELGLSLGKVYYNYFKKGKLELTPFKEYRIYLNSQSANLKFGNNVFGITNDPDTKIIMRFEFSIDGIRTESGFNQDINEPFDYTIVDRDR